RSITYPDASLLTAFEARPPALRPDVGRWCTSTKVPASIPGPPTFVLNRASVARMTPSLSPRRHESVLRGTVCCGGCDGPSRGAHEPMGHLTGQKGIVWS